MNLEFRQRTPAEYVQLIWSNKWLILLPTLAISVAVAYVVYRLPNVYESTTLVVVKPPTIPNSVVPSLTDVDISLRLNTITQVVMSRTTLQPLVERLDLYATERGRGETMESLIEQMRRDIDVEVDRSRNDIANAFRITYRGREPRSTQAVAAELARQYTNAQTKDVTTTSTQTKAFFEQQAAEAKAALEKIDQARLEYMSSNLGTLPSEAGALIGQLTGVRERERSLMTEIGRMRDQRNVMSSQLSELEKQSKEDRMDIIEEMTDPKKTPAYAQLVSRKSQLEAEYQTMLITLKPKNPDVLQKKAEIDSVQREMTQMIDEQQAKVEEKRKKLESRSDPRITTLRNNIGLIDNEIARQQKALDQTESNIGALEQRLNGVPGTQVGLEKLNRDYQTQKSIYDSLLENKQKADLASSVASNQQGEQIQVIDPASLPDRPVAPKRERLFGLGILLGLGVGVLLAAAREVPRLLTIQSTKDAEHYTGLPVLAAVPQMLTARERTRLKMRQVALAVGGLVVTLVSIPALILLLRATHIFERFVV